jgi:hypothetical protein
MPFASGKQIGFAIRDWFGSEQPKFDAQKFISLNGFGVTLPYHAGGAEIDIDARKKFNTDLEREMRQRGVKTAPVHFGHSLHYVAVTKKEYDSPKYAKWRKQEEEFKKEEANKSPRSRSPRTRSPRSASPRERKSPRSRSPSPKASSKVYTGAKGGKYTLDKNGKPRYLSSKKQ